MTVPADHLTHNSKLTIEQVIALGIVAADVRVWIQPDTTSVGPTLAHIAGVQKLPLIIKTIANPVSAVSVAIGSAYAGVRTAVYVESQQLAEVIPYILAAEMAENPLVVVAKQAIADDPQYVLNIINSCPVVLMAGSCQEIFQLIQDACNIAEQYQVPVVVLVGSHQEYLQTDDSPVFHAIGRQRGQLLTAKRAAALKTYQRYALTKTGNSPRKIPGQAGQPSLANMFPHSADGIRSQNQKSMDEQAMKREEKLLPLKAEVLPLKVHGQTKAPLTLLCAGLDTTLALRAIQLLEQDDIPISLVQLLCVSPFPSGQLNSLIRSSRILAVFAFDDSSPLPELVQQQTGFKLPVLSISPQQAKDPATVLSSLIKDKFIIRK